MRMKKLLCALLAGCMASTATVGTSALPVNAADSTIPLIFDFQCAGSNQITLGYEGVQAGDIAITVSVYVPSNPGLSSANLKLQVNDGEEDEDGNLKNYGFYLSDAALENPFCFDSANSGNPDDSLVSLFSAAHMNLTWAYSQDETKNADAFAEAGTTSWTKDVAWAYKYAFATANIVIPKGTAPGEYKLGVRKEKYKNSLAAGASVSLYNQSMCLSGESEEPLEFTVVPLSIIVADATTTTTTTTTQSTEKTTTTTSATKPDTTTSKSTTKSTEKTTTTTSATKPDTTTSKSTTKSTEKTTTTTTTSATKPDTTTSKSTTKSTEKTTTTTTTSATKPDTTTSKSTTKSTEKTTTTTTETTTLFSGTDSSTLPTETTTSGNPATAPWKDDYAIENGGLYYIIGDVCGKPGEEVEVPVYVYGDTGTCAIRVYIAYDERIQEIEATDSERNWAYTGGWTCGRKNPICMVTIPNGGFNAKAEDGSILFSMYCTIPEDAAPGTTYRFRFSSAIDPDTNTTKFCEVLESINDDKTETAPLNVKYYDGSLTVLGDSATPVLNYSSYSLNKVGETINLSLFNAIGDVTWSSSDEKVATVDKNGFVTAAGFGDVVITATNQGNDYTCAVHVGVFGDVNRNGRVESTDSMVTLIAAADIRLGMEPSLDAAQLAIADVDGDGKLSVKDAQYILMFYGNTIAHIDCNWRDLTGNPNAPDYSNLG